MKASLSLYVLKSSPKVYYLLVDFGVVLLVLVLVVTGVNLHMHISSIIIDDDIHLLMTKEFGLCIGSSQIVHHRQCRIRYFFCQFYLWHERQAFVI